MTTKYAVIDVETTGGRAGEEGITEIAIFIFDGKNTIDQFISLVNPERSIQPFVQQLTGITPQMVARAPKFYELAKRIVHITEDCVFVAHNAPFDYRMVQDEFARLGYDYNRKVLDTIPLARKLIPGLKSYGLDSLCESLDISNTHRHRADGDARATVRLLEILLEKDRERSIEGLALDTTLEVRGEHKFSKEIHSFRDTTGVYYLYNEAGKVIYVGQAERLRNKIDRHYLATNEKALALQKEAVTLRVEETGSVLLARMLEHLALKKLNPFYNKLKDRHSLGSGMFWVDRPLPQEPSDESFSPGWEVRHIKQENPALYLERSGHGQEYVRLWEQHIKPEKELWNRKEAEASILRMLLPKNALLIDRGRKTGEKTAFLIENHQLTGYVRTELATSLVLSETLRTQSTPLPQSPYISGLLIHALRGQSLDIRLF